MGNHIDGGRPFAALQICPFELVGGQCAAHKIPVEKSPCITSLIKWCSGVRSLGAGLTLSGVGGGFFLRNIFKAEHQRQDKRQHYRQRHDAKTQTMVIGLAGSKNWTLVNRPGAAMVAGRPSNAGHRAADKAADQAGD